MTEGIPEYNLLNAIIESSPDVIIFALDRKYRYISYNTYHKKVMKQIWGKEISLGVNMLELIGLESDRIRAKENFDRALSGEHFVLNEEYGDEKLSRFYWAVYYSPIFSSNGSVIGLSCFNLNQTKQREAEEQVKNLLNEKEIILKEVHHRVKNNMTAMYSLLKLQAGATDNDDVERELGNAAVRIRSAMVLYEKLYRSETMLTISLKLYIESLVEGIQKTLPQGGRITVRTDIEDVIIQTVMMSHIGMILTELITNSFKHAFIEPAMGEILIVVRKRGDELNLEYSDNGIGIPEDVIADIRNAGFGMHLIGMLADQMNATLEITNESGTKVSVILPI